MMKEIDHDGLKRLLLDLLSPRKEHPYDVLTRLTTEEQNALLLSVCSHRLGPILRHMLRKYHPGVAVPQSIAEAIDQSYRASALRSLLAQQHLIAIAQLLRDQGIAYIALKGAYLAFHAYPQSALRPLRDLDILVPRDRALEVYELLLKNGYRRCKNYQGNPEVVHESTHHHLPPLLDKTGRLSVEIHTRLTPDNVTPSLTEGHGFWERAFQKPIGNKMLRFESPNDLLMHLIHHAVYQHQFDNGPLLLSDIAFLLETHKIEWTLFWDQAQNDRLTPGCVLVLKLLERYWTQLPIIWPMSNVAWPSQTILDDAALMLLRDYENRNEVTLKKNSGRSKNAYWAILSLRKAFPSKNTICTIYPVKPESLKVYGYYLLNLWRLTSNRLPKILGSHRSTHGQEIVRIHRIESWLRTCGLDNRL